MNWDRPLKPIRAPNPTTPRQGQLDFEGGGQVQNGGTSGVPAVVASHDTSQDAPETNSHTGVDHDNENHTEILDHLEKGAL